MEVRVHQHYRPITLRVFTLLVSQVQVVHQEHQVLAEQVVHQEVQVQVVHQEHQVLAEHQVQVELRVQVVLQELVVLQVHQEVQVQVVLVEQVSQRLQILR